MKKLTKTPIQLATLFLAVGIWTLTSCGGGHDHGDHGGDHGSDAGAGSGENQEQVDDHADHDGHADDNAAQMDSTATDMQEMESLDAKFAPGSMEAELSDFMDNGTGIQVFTLDKIPFEGDELSADGDAQLDAIADMLKAHPDLKMEIQGHTRQAENAVGRGAKKVASGARADWVKLKLVAKGVDGKQLTTKGYADERLLADVDPEDEKQRRLTVEMTK